jgi:excisionase family DNA binding protein
MLITTAAEYLECKRTMVEELIRSGELGCIQFTKRGDRRILREELDAFLERRRREPVS